MNFKGSTMAGCVPCYLLSTLLILSLLSFPAFAVPKASVYLQSWLLCFFFSLKDYSYGENENPSGFFIDLFESSFLFFVFLRDYSNGLTPSGFLNYLSESPLSSRFFINSSESPFLLSVSQVMAFGILIY